MNHKFDTPISTGLAVIAILAFYALAAWLDNDHSASAPQTHQCGNANLSTHSDGTVTCVRRKPLNFNKVKQ
jgi:hypothetical protein